MHIYEDFSKKLLTSIKKGEAPFKFIPQKIGTLKFCYTDNDMAELYTNDVIQNKFITWIGGLYLVVVLCWIIFNNSPIFNSIVYSIALIAIYNTIRNLTYFKRTDYFVGTAGFAILKFEQNRDNFTQKSVYLYDDYSELITGETMKSLKEIFRSYGKKKY